MIRRILLLSSIGAAALAVAPSAMAAPHIGGCTLNGTADFANPLLTNPGTSPAFGYSFSGTLSTSCASPCRLVSSRSIDRTTAPSLRASATRSSSSSGA